MNERIAVVDDELEILELVSLHLKQAFFVPAVYQTAEEFLSSLDEQKPDLIVLDINLPDADGVELCKVLQSKPELAGIPIIMLTVKSEVTDKILGLESGADDYVAKPFFPKELIARIRAVLRRMKTMRTAPGKPFYIGDILTIDPEKYRIFVEGRDIGATATEFRIVEFMAHRPGVVFTRDQILDHLWGTDKIVIDRTIDVHIKNVRKKLGLARNFIHNIRGVGYMIEA